MKTKKTCVRILLTALVVSLCAGCSGNNGASESASTGKTERSRKYEVGEGIPKEDITEFTYTISNSINPPRYEQYRFFMEDGAYRFSFVQENVAGDTGSRSGELASASGTLELTDTEWDELYDCLEGGSAKKKEEDRNAETGGTYYTYQLYWNGDREKYRTFSFASSRRESEFEALCEDYVARANMAGNGNEAQPGRLSADATPEDFTSFDEVLAYYREVLPTIDPYVYDESVEGTFAEDLYSYYIGYWPADPLHNFYYAYTDLNGDGTDEMLVGAINDQYETVHQILSIGKQDGRVYMIASAGYRSLIDIHTDGTFSWGGSYSAGAYTDFVYRLNDTGDMREFIEGYKYDDLEEIAGGPWYRAIPTGEMYEGFYEMHYEPIPEAEAQGMMEKYTIQSFRWSMLADG